MKKKIHDWIPFNKRKKKEIYNEICNKRKKVFYSSN